MEILENYHREVSTIMLDREIQLQQMMKLQLISLNLLIEYKNELQSLDTGCKCGCQKFLAYFEPYHLTITVSYAHRSNCQRRIHDYQQAHPRHHHCYWHDYHQQHHHYRH